MNIEAWNATHPRWDELTHMVQDQGQTDWVTFHAPFHLSEHTLVALEGDTILGFLRFVTQHIGPDMGCPPVTFRGKALLEGKVLAFAVVEKHRNRGVGRALQQEVIRSAKALGCYQVRSHSSGENRANHHLKLALGFAVHPIVRGEDRGGAYFVLPIGFPHGPGDVLSEWNGEHDDEAYRDL